MRGAVALRCRERSSDSDGGLHGKRHGRYSRLPLTVRNVASARCVPCKCGMAMETDCISHLSRITRDARSARRPQRCRWSKSSSTCNGGTKNAARRGCETPIQPDVGRWGVPLLKQHHHQNQQTYETQKSVTSSTAAGRPASSAWQRVSSLIFLW